MTASQTDGRTECKFMHLSAYPVEMSVCHSSCVATFRDEVNSSGTTITHIRAARKRFNYIPVDQQNKTDRDLSMGDLLNQFSIY